MTEQKRRCLILISIACSLASIGMIYRGGKYNDIVSTTIGILLIMGTLSSVFTLRNWERTSDFLSNRFIELTVLVGLTFSALLTWKAKTTSEYLFLISYSGLTCVAIWARFFFNTKEETPLTH